MDDFRLGVVETRFAELIWAHEPLSSGELVKLCARELEWKKSTTYTVLKKLCDRGLFQNQDGIVTSIPAGIPVPAEPPVRGGYLFRLSAGLHRRFCRWGKSDRQGHF